jgi:hypothetical protein
MDNVVSLFVYADIFLQLHWHVVVIVPGTVGVANLRWLDRALEERK